MFAYAKLTIFYDITYLLLHKLCDKGGRLGCNMPKQKAVALHAGWTTAKILFCGEIVTVTFLAWP